MTLTSLSFFLFLLASLAVYYVIPKKARWVALLAASVAFYAIICLKYIPFILFTALSTWAGGLWLGRYTDSRADYLKAHKGEWDQETKKAYKHTTMIRKRLILTLVLVVNFGILAVLKYYNFLAGWIGTFTDSTLPTISLLLPLGISFYTFQSMGYIIDLYWGKVSPEKNPARFLLFVTFFPQIVQGPIAMYSDLAPQLFEGHALNYENIKEGFQLVLWGLFKKMVIADRLVIVLNTLLPVKNEVSNAYSLLLLVVYAAQLYMDFSGGIDIIRGAAQMFGITMAENFRRPFFSDSIADFWRRWHISLCKWLKNYLFYPMALSKAFLRFGTWISSKGKQPEDLPEDSLWGGYTFLQHLGRVLPGCIGTIITFLIIGMWHGANWKYAGYGLWNGILIFLAMLLEPFFRWLCSKLKIQTSSVGWRIWRILRTAFIVGLSFVFDIADSFSDGLVMLGRCLTPTLGPTPHLGEAVSTGLELKDWMAAIIALLIVLAVSLFQEISGQSLRKCLGRQTLWLQWVLMLGCILAVVIFGVYGPGVSSGEFVYMQF